VAYTVITAAAAEPISLAELYLQCRTDSSEDSLLTLCLKGARAKCEAMIGRALINRTVDQSFADFDDMLLELLPVGTLTSVKYYDTAGAQQTLSSTYYELANVDGRPMIVAKANTTWPELQEISYPVTVRYVAGYGAAAANVPDDIRTWILMTAAFLYAQAEAMDTTGKTVDIPSRFVDGLIDPYKVY
jgi:uncharacterized phiE125 gp8 family phage protein